MLNRRLRVGVSLLVLIAPVGLRSAAAQDAAIPADGLELWVKADGPMKLNGTQITEWSDSSGKNNHAVHDTSGAAIPTLATANGKPTLRFSGAFTGFHFNKITHVRTVFAVLSKVPSSCLPTLPNYGTPAKFWLGGAADPTYFHPEHGCNIYNGNLSEVSPNLVNGKTYLNGKQVEGRTTRFPFELGLLSIVSTADVAADTIARDRNYQDRSWQGDISELLIYSKALDDATRVKIQNALATKYTIDVLGAGVVLDAGTPDGDAGAGSAGGGSGGTSSTAGGGGAAAIGGAPSTGGAPTFNNSAGTAGSSPPGNVGGASGGAGRAGLSMPSPRNTGCSCATLAKRASSGRNGSAAALVVVVSLLALSRRRRGPRAAAGARKKSAP